MRLPVLLSLALLVGCTAAPAPPPAPAPAPRDWHDLVGRWTFEGSQKGERQVRTIAFEPAEEGLRVVTWAQDPTGEPDSSVLVVPGQVTTQVQRESQAQYRLIDGRVVVAYQWTPAKDASELGVAVGEFRPTGDGRLVWHRVGSSWDADGPSGWDSVCTYTRAD